MKVLMISKACVVGAYQRKLEEMAALPGVQLTVAVPPEWRGSQGRLPLERTYTQGYTLRSEPIRFNGHFHLHYYPQIGRLVAQVQPDIVHIDEEPYNLATWHILRLARRAGARTLFFSWQNLHRRYPPPFSWIERQVLRQVDGAIFGNRAAAEVWQQKGYRGPGVVIPQFGVDPQLFSPPAGRQPPTGSLTVAYIGRLVPEKGVDLLVRALAGLDAGYRLEIVGGGPEQPRLAQLAESLGVAGRVRFVEWMPSTAVPGYLAGVDALALPSLTHPNWMEQFGRVLVEAMASGVPVVGSASGEIPNVIGDAGLVVAEGDVNGLRAALAHLGNDEAFYQQCMARGRARVLERFTQARVATQTVDFYRKLVG